MDNSFAYDVQQLYLSDANTTEDLYRIYLGDYEQQEINDREQVWQCVHGVLDSIHSNIFLLLVVTLLQRLIAVTCIPTRLKHFSAIICALFILHKWTFNLTMFYSTVASVLSLQLFILFVPSPWKGMIVTSFCILAIVMLELCIPAEIFNSFRGCLMIFSMKLSALAFDVQLDWGWKELLPSLAYLFNPSTIIFGPFTTYTEYIFTYERRSIKEELLSLIKCCMCLSLSVCCLLYSSCAFILFPTGGLLSDFSIAQSFRMSHYFICFLAQGLSVLSGLSTPISNPFAIEFPRSLVEVVVAWNIPMHRYLHKYTYLKCAKLGPATAVFITFLVSSLLHGLNFQLSAVLVSLGLYCYYETKLRNSLSLRFSACVRTRVCRNCNHMRKQHSSLSLLFNLLFFVLSMYHLTYLGMPFNGEGAEEGYHWKHTVKIWGQHYYISHIIAMLTAILSYMV